MNSISYAVTLTTGSHFNDPSIGLYNGANLIDRVTYGTDSTVKNYSINLAAPGIGKSGALMNFISSGIVISLLSI